MDSWTNYSGERPTCLPGLMVKPSVLCHVDHLKSIGCKLPGSGADNGTQLGGLPHKESEFRGPMTGGSSVSLESPITGCGASTPQNFAVRNISQSREDSSVPKEGTGITLETNLGVHHSKFSRFGLSTAEVSSLREETTPKTYF